jgi:twitching motility two-component system response regulator PilH
MRSWLKADAALACIPVVIVSTEGKDADTIRGLRAGAAAYVRKPFRNEAVVTVIRQVLERGSSMRS